jgi:hypothetical protein
MESFVSVLIHVFYSVEGNSLVKMAFGARLEANYHNICCTLLLVFYDIDVQ